MAAASGAALKFSLSAVYRRRDGTVKQRRAGRRGKAALSTQSPATINPAGFLRKGLQMTSSEHYAVARRHMVESQVRPNKVTDDRVADAMLDTPRELFVPKPFRGVAYMDEDIKIAHGRFLIEPMVFARLLQEAGIEAGDTVLDIGCGTGYSTAVLGHLAGTVVALEGDRDLAARATEILAELGIDNAAVVEGPLNNGLPDQGPFDIILLNGSVADVPDALINQIAEGGRMMAVIVRKGIGRATRFDRINGLVSHRDLFDASIPALPGFSREPGFVF